jgi:hypothetical protein
LRPISELVKQNLTKKLVKTRIWSRNWTIPNQG